MTNAAHNLRPAVARKLAKALRSGKYKKCSGRLRNGSQMCASGVLCDISGLGRWVGDAYEAGGECRAGFPPTKVKKWATGTRIGPVIGDVALFMLNDRPTSFAKIADMLDPPKPPAKRARRKP